MLALSRVGLSSRAAVRPAMLIRGFKTIPQPPGHIVGTVNDAYVPPPPSKSAGSYHWTSERIVAVGMVPLVLAPFLTGTSSVLDSSLAAALLYHCHAGFQSCIIDYIPKRVYGPYHNYAVYLLTFGTGVAGYGLYEIESKEETGLSTILSKLWNA
ncbi:mitochondrial inner membrane protein Shh4p [[Candida] anglica]|uniref:Succinate dehydrogenase [ubiquinone] cytochrome b small subunit n=1 Tax=[Candida] anglica TaxID=148631 RepID=A0ABP0EQE9_9ASCO